MSMACTKPNWKTESLKVDVRKGNITNSRPQASHVLWETFKKANHAQKTLKLKACKIFLSRRSNDFQIMGKSAPLLSVPLCFRII